MTLNDIASHDWDALFPAEYPFTRHAFLSALERNSCVGEGTGWEPAHVALRNPDGTLHAAMPLYRKLHSFGEFVFDFAWAQAAQRARMRYYPKLTCSVPFTPATGPRLGARTDEDRAALLAAAEAAREACRASSVHALFLNDDDANAAARAGWLARNDVQFHWQRKGAENFEAFVAQLSHDKRKKILRERRRVREEGLTFEHRRGDELNEAQWARVYALYANTYDERGQAPYLTFEFFLDYARAKGSPVRVVLGYHGGQDPIAAAICVAGGDTLYGRHWGCAEKYSGLHFETCYYQGLELCFASGFSRFDAGAQGEHKLSRGFEPVVTRSAHRLADEPLANAVAEFLGRERAAVARMREEYASHSPYRSETQAGPAEPKADG